MAACIECFDAVDQRVIQQLYILRSQVRHLYVDCELLKKITESLKQDFDELHAMYDSLK